MEIVEGIKQAIEDLITRLAEQETSTPTAPKQQTEARFWTILYHRNPYFTARVEVLLVIDNLSNFDLIDDLIPQWGL